MRVRVNEARKNHLAAAVERIVGMSFKALHEQGRRADRCNAVVIDQYGAVLDAFELRVHRDDITVCEQDLSGQGLVSS